MHQSLLLFILLFLSTHLALGQDPITKKYRAKDGLLSNQVYDIVQDKDGYLWIATDHGVQKFDGYSFHQVDLSIINNDPILRFHSDYKGRLWAVSNSNYIVQFRNDSVIPHPMSKAFNKTTKYVSFSLVMDTNDVLWITTDADNGEFQIHQDKIIKTKILDSLNHFAYARFTKVGDKFSIWKHSPRRPKPLVNYTKLSALQNGFELKIMTPDLGHYRFALIERIDSNTAAVSLASKFFIVRNNSIIFEAEPSKGHDILDIFIDNNNDIWISVFRKGLIRYDSRMTPHQYFDGKSISKIFQDREGNYWFGSLDNGLWFTQSLLTSQLHIADHINIKGSAIKDSTIYFTSFDKFYKYEIGTGETTLIKEASAGVFFRKPYIFNNEIWITGRKLYTFDETKTKTVIRMPHNCDGLTMDNKKNLILGCSYSAIGVIARDNFVHYSVDQPPFIGRVNDLCHLNDTVWIGSKLGLASMSIKDTSFRSYPFRYTINSIKVLNGSLWIGTPTNGIWVIKNKQMEQISSEDGLINNTIHNLYAENDSTIWAIHNIGVSRIRVHSHSNYIVNTYLNQKYLDHTLFTSISKFGDQYYISHNDGFYILEPKKENLIAAPPILHLSALHVNKKLTDLHAQSQIFKHDENDFEFEFIAPVFKNHDQLRYHFMIDGVDESYNIKSTTSCAYYNLPPGYHRFRVKAENADGLFSEEQVFEFRIRKHFSETAWFRLGFVALLLLLVASFFIRVNRRRKIQMAQERELYKTELKAIRSQMNPHFVFNSMNSIQNLVLSEEVEGAYEYLSKFSQLMRWTLNYSRKSHISLREEIEFLETYLELEQLRFKDKFTPVFEIDPDIDQSFLQIPPFFLQPVIENAIIHGLSPLKSGGKLFIRFQLTDNELHIEVEDNGVGREKAASLNKIRKKHQSQGINNIHERIILLNEMDKTDIRFATHDLYENGEASGTLIIFSIPTN